MRDTLLLSDYQPRSELVVPEHHPPKAKHAAIDAHNHLPVDHPRMQAADLDQLVREMDFLNVQTIVNLSGGRGDLLKRSVETLEEPYPGRFATFCNVDWTDVGQPGWIETTTSQLEANVRAGACGLKIFKRLGLLVRDGHDQLVMPDDPRIAPLWDAAAELRVPVLIHTADPVAFFRPRDRFNERWFQLQRHPEWHFYGPEFPAFEELIASLYRVIEAHPRTDFITAHVGCYPENLGFVSQMLDRYPNLYTDIAARIKDLGRAPYSARKLFIKHADRILFGTDARPSISTYQTHFRFLETADEYIEYAPPPRGSWRIYGVSLPDRVLQRVYHDNAARLLRLG